MFNANFYPTPREVIERMCFGIDLLGKKVLEPSAGSGNIITYAKELGAIVTACEINHDLAMIASKKADKFLKHDFMQVKSEEVSHMDYIIMNPPFSADEKHILHAWEVAPEGCQIVALCNWNTLKNPYSSARTKLRNLVDQNGSSEELGNAFSTADRETDVYIGMVKLYKPKTGDNEFEGYFDMTEQEERQENGIMAYNEIRNIVNRYVGAVKTFNEVVEASDKMNSLIDPINGSGRIKFGAVQYRDGKDYKITRDEFKKELQKSAWKSIFDKMNMQKYVTRSIMEDINKFVEQQVQVPFTMKNIYSMIELIVLTHGNRMDKVLTEAFDRICSLSFDNSEAGKGWKTNSNYKVNQRFIDTYICEFDSRWPTNHTKISSSGRDDKLDDIVKALCFMTGKNYEEVTRMEYDNQWGKKESCRRSLYNFFNHNHTDWGQWVQWNEFFRVRGYKKGTMHFEFLDENVWMEFNRRVAKIKGWQLPKNTDRKQKGTERTRKEGVEVY